MSEEITPQIAIKFVGRGMVPGMLRSRELADIIASFEEMLACVVADRHSNIEKDDVLVGLAAIGGGSIRLGFNTIMPSVVVAAYLSVASAVDKNDFTSLPSNSLTPLNRIVAFTRRYHCVAELFSPGTDEHIASITPETDTKISGLIQGQTTIYGRILRVGGKTPRVMIETIPGDTLSCVVSLEIARELGERLYEFAEFSGIASWNANDWKIAEFRIQSFTISSTKTPEQTMNELRSLVGRYFEGIDAEAYVSFIRGETEDI
jgi:hypothetical protein